MPCQWLLGRNEEEEEEKEEEDKLAAATGQKMMQGKQKIHLQTLDEPVEAGAQACEQHPRKGSMKHLESSQNLQQHSPNTQHTSHTSSSSQSSAILFLCPLEARSSQGESGVARAVAGGGPQKEWDPKKKTDDEGGVEVVGAGERDCVNAESETPFLLFIFFFDT